MMRIAEDTDADAVADLVNADPLAGQPTCRADDVRLAMAGAANMERAWWDAFTDLTTVVATDDASLVGAASCAVHSREQIGYVLWLHAREEPKVVGDVLTELLHRLAPQRCVRAFWIATPLTLGAEALPARHRPITAAALTRLGFSARDQWLYMLGRPVTAAADAGRVEPKGRNEWELTICDPTGATVGTVTVELGRDGVGVVWWLEVKPPYRGQSYGRALLLQAMTLLGSAGAERLILYVDHDDPSTRDRRPAIRLYESVGFRTVDNLWSYELTR